MKKIPLSGKNGRGKFAMVDNDDFEALSKTAWWCRGGYAVGRTVKGKSKQQMHRVIMGLNNPKIICDHINRDKLDNRKCNLRIATNKQNSWNSTKHKNFQHSAYKGVSFDKVTGKYTAYIRVGNGKRISIGRFNKEIEAAAAYNVFAKKYHGEYANINDVPLKIEKSIKFPKRLVKTSKYKGVCKNNRGQWVVRIKIKNQKEIYLSGFKTELEAVKAYNREAKKLGKPLNKIQKGQK